MEDQLKQIIESLPEKPPRSRLAPYAEFIEELRRLGRTYREISAILAEKCELHASASTIHDFIRLNAAPKAHVRVPKSERRKLSAKSGRALADSMLKTDSDLTLRDRIQALRRTEKDVRPRREVFQFDASEPLRLNNPSKRREF